MGRIIDFETIAMRRFFGACRDQLEAMASEIIEAYFDNYGHGADLAVEVLQGVYEDAEDKDIGRMIVSDLIMCIEMRGYWKQAMNLRDLLASIRNITHEQRVEAILHRLRHLEGNHWMDDNHVMHGELVVKI